MQSKVLCKRVEEMIAPKALEISVNVWDVEFKKEGSIYNLTIYIDSGDGINIEHCEAISRYVDPLLDEPEFDSLPAYTLCVSSAGAERKLERAEHYEYAKGKMVTVKFYGAKDGSKTFDGEFETCDGETLMVAGKTFDMKEVSSVNIKLEI